MLSVLQEAKISLLNNMNCVITSVLLCVDIMRQSDGFETCCLFTFFDIHKLNTKCRCTKLTIIYIYIYTQTKRTVAAQFLVRNAIANCMEVQQSVQSTMSIHKRSDRHTD